MVGGAYDITERQYSQPHSIKWLIPVHNKSVKSFYRAVWKPIVSVLAILVLLEIISPNTVAAIFVTNYIYHKHTHTHTHTKSGDNVSIISQYIVYVRFITFMTGRGYGTMHECVLPITPLINY